MSHTTTSIFAKRNAISNARAAARTAELAAAQAKVAEQIRDSSRSFAEIKASYEAAFDAAQEALLLAEKKTLYPLLRDPGLDAESEFRAALAASEFASAQLRVVRLAEENTSN